MGSDAAALPIWYGQNNLTLVKNRHDNTRQALNCMFVCLKAAFAGVVSHMVPTDKVATWPQGDGVDRTVHVI